VRADGQVRYDIGKGVGAGLVVRYGSRTS
jgi:hypothetical protein